MRKHCQRGTGERVLTLVSPSWLCCTTGASVPRGRARTATEYGSPPSSRKAQINRTVPVQGDGLRVTYCGPAERHEEE